VTNLTETEEYQWSMYKTYRINAIWFSRTEPIKLALRKQLDQDTLEFTARTLECTPKELRGATEHWIGKTIELWVKNQWKPRHALSADTSPSSTNHPNGTTTTNTSSVKTATPYGVPDCYCPECMLEIIRQYQNPALKLELEKCAN